MGSTVAPLPWNSVCALYMAFKFNRKRTLVWSMLFLGTATPLALILTMVLERTIDGSKLRRENGQCGVRWTALLILNQAAWATTCDRACLLEHAKQFNAAMLGRTPEKSSASKWCADSREHQGHGTWREPLDGRNENIVGRGLCRPGPGKCDRARCRQLHKGCHAELVTRRKRGLTFC